MRNITLNMGADTLTDLECLATYYAAFQPSGLKGKYKAAFRRAARKLDNQRRILRHRAIYAAGRRAGQSGVEYPRPVFEGRELGSMESMTFYDGVASVRSGFRNPYRRTT